MDVQQLKANTRQLEKDIAELLARFMKENDIALEEVNIDIYDCATLGDVAKSRRSAIVVNVNCKIAF